MKAVSCKQGKLSVIDKPELVPGKGHVILDVLRCGICGSDLHMRTHCNHYTKTLQQAGVDGSMTFEQDVVMGHEFCGEVVDFGSGCHKKIKPGTRVCAVPLLKRGSSFDMIGFSEKSSGAYAERILVQESLMMPIPNGLSNDIAALTEPMAVGLHAVNRSEIKKNELAIVVGCGPVGLAIISCLKAMGVRHVVACDFSEARRKLALQCGADTIIDPSIESPYKNWESFKFINRLDSAFDLLLKAKETMDRLPLPWWHLWNIADKLGATAPKRPVIFECVGVSGLLQNIITDAPLFSRIIVVGVCMEQDKIQPALAINKEIDLRFVLGYSPLEYRNTLHLLAEGKLNAAPLITGTVGLYGVESAFSALGDPDKHAKILIDPNSTKTEPTI